MTSPDPHTQAPEGAGYPDDIRDAVNRIVDAAIAAGDDLSTEQLMARAIMAERERCAQIADEHALRCSSKIHKKRSDHDLAVFESAASEAMSIAASIRGEG